MHQGALGGFQWLDDDASLLSCLFHCTLKDAAVMSTWFGIHSFMGARSEARNVSLCAKAAFLPIDIRHLEKMRALPLILSERVASGTFQQAVEHT